MDKLARDARLELRKAGRTEEATIVGKLKSEINSIVSICGLDAEKMDKRIKVALRSEFGRINGMINLLVAVANWPAEQGDGASVSANQTAIETTLGMDMLLLEDIKTYRGHHTFHNDALEVIAGQAPVYDMYEDYCSILLENLGFTRMSATIDPSRWEVMEAAAKRKTAADLIELRVAAAAYESAIAAI